MQIVHANRISDGDLPSSANVYTARRGLPDILDYVKQVIESARNTITNISNSLSALIKEFQEKINETVSSIHISLIINQLRKEIANTVAQGGVLSQQCGKEADAQVNELVGRSNKASQECIKNTQKIVTQLDSSIKNLANRARDILDQFVVQVISCVQNNMFNPIGLIKCLQSQIDLFKQEMDKIQQEVELSVAEAKNNVKESVFELAECVNDVQLNTIKTAQIILVAAETCIAGK